MALLGVLFFSLLIPCIEVTTRHQVEVQQAMLSIEQLLLMAESEPTPVEVGAVQETPAISWVQIVLLVYLAGILFLVCRNIYSLICLFRLVHSGKHEKLEKGGYTCGAQSGDSSVQLDEVYCHQPERPGGKREGNPYS
jgi:hypothetical protein